MGIDSKAGFVGLVTAVSELGANAGALAIADNVTLRKEGALTCRPVYTSAALLRAYRAAFPYLGQLIYIGDSGANKNTIFGPTETALLVGQTPPVREDVQSAKDSRGNLYVAASSGIFKLTSPSAALEPTGILPGEAALYQYTLVTTGSPLLLQPNQHVAYRFVSTRKDVNGVALRSRPTGAHLIANTTAAPASPSLVVALRSGTNIDAVEVYRTRVFPITAQVDDELQLVATLDPALFNNLPPPFYTFVDHVLDTERGETLYTSPSRGGIENANDRPPGAACLERFRGSLFFGNLHQPPRVVFSYRYSGAFAITGQATGIGRREATANTTNGSTSLTSVTPLVGLQVGQTVQGPGVDGIVTAIAGSTVTINQPATATAAAVTLVFDDVIVFTIGGTTAFGRLPFSATGTAPSYGLSGNGLATAYQITPPEPGYDVTVVFEAVARGPISGMTISASHGNEYSPPLPATPTPVEWENIPNGLAWAEPDEPEHVPPKNFARVGDTGKAILALVSTRDRLLIFKEDGLFQLTGQLANNFALYPLDTTCLCILPGSTRRVQNTVYTLSNLGLVAVDEGGGVTIVSRPIQVEIARIVNLIRAAHKTSGLYLMPGLLGNTGSNDEAEGEYHLALGTSGPTFFGGPPAGGHVLVYSMPRGGFTTFSFPGTPPVALTTDGEGIPRVLCALSILTPTTALGPVSARICPRAFSDPALAGKLWTHLVACFSDLTGTTSVSARFTSSESMLTTPIVTEQLEAPATAGLIQLPNGSLLRHPLPRAVTRATLLFVELLVAVSNGRFTFEAMGVESRDNIPNKRPTHGTGVS